MTGDNVQVSSVQTLARRLDRTREPDLLIIDECHHTNAATWKNILAKWTKTRILGVTATPCRLDGKGLGVHAGGYFDRLIMGPTVQELIDLGFLSLPMCYGPEPAQVVDMSGVKISGGDYDHKAASDRLDKPRITGDVLDHYQKICPGVPAIGFCCSIAHATHVCETFNSAGVRSEVIHGKLPDAQRKRMIESLADGRISVLWSCDIISEGTDIPIVGAGIMLRPTQSLNLCLQQMGRILRIYPGKKQAIILDHVGNCARHGLPEWDREWSLDGTVKSKRAPDTAPAVRQCEKCFMWFYKAVKICPHCGWDYSTGTTHKKEIEQQAGELQLLQNRIAEEQQKKQDRRELGRDVGSAESLEEMVRIAKRRGYKPGWAHIRWHLKQSRKNNQKNNCPENTNRIAY